MKEPILFRRNDTLAHDQALYWKDLLYRIVKVGAELEFALPRGVRKDELMPELEAALKPSRDVDALGPHGVLDVVSEHCGVEIRVLGRQPYYPALVDQYRRLFAQLPPGIRARPTCGLHYHVLAVGLTEPMPEIVLANVWNLTRRYAPELRFLTSGGHSLEALCRRRNYCSHLEMVRYTPGTLRMHEIQQRLHDSRQVPEHNNFFNLEHIVFHPDGAIKVLHYENRFPDADLSPTGVVVKAFLFLAMLLKAVEMSQYGVIHVGRIEEWRRKVALLDLLSNNDGPLATSDTGGVTPQIVEELRSGARELLELLKPTFDRFEHNPSFEVLSLLAETPVSLLRASGRDWPEIEALLAERAATEEGALDNTDRKLMRCIELAELAGCGAFDAWKWAAASTLFLTPRELDRRLEVLDRLRGLRWDAQVGAVVFVR